MKKIEHRGFHIISAILLGIFLPLFSLTGTFAEKVDLASFEEQFAKELTEIRGTPKVRIVSNQKEAFRVELEKKDQDDYTLLIRKEGNDYVWVSREGKILAHSISGAFDHFISEDGAGYIKVAREASAMNPLKGFDASVQEEQFGCKYIEHMNHMLSTVTYFGDCDIQ